MTKGGGSEGGGESEDLINGSCSPKNEDSKDGTIIEPLNDVEHESEDGDEYIQESRILATPIQLAISDQDDVLQDAELNTDMQEKLLTEVPFRVVGKEEMELKEESVSVTTICIPYADSTTSQPEHVPYLSKHLMKNAYKLNCSRLECLCETGRLQLIQFRICQNL